MFGLEGGELGAEGGESGDGVLVCGGEGGEFGLERVCFAVVGVHSRVHCAVKLGGRRHCVGERSVEKTGRLGSGGGDVWCGVHWVVMWVGMWVGM